MSVPSYGLQVHRVVGVNDIIHRERSLHLVVELPRFVDLRFHVVTDVPCHMFVVFERGRQRSGKSELERILVRSCR